MSDLFLSGALPLNGIEERDAAKVPRRPVKAVRQEVPVAKDGEDGEDVSRMPPTSAAAFSLLLIIEGECFPLFISSSMII